MNDFLYRFDVLEKNYLHRMYPYGFLRPEVWV